MLQVGSLQVDHLGQELVLQTVPGYSEVDERGLGLDLWLVVRVSQLSVEDQLELWVEETLLISDLYTTTVRERMREMGEEEFFLGALTSRFVYSKIMCVCICHWCMCVLPALLDGVSSQ